MKRRHYLFLLLLLGLTCTFANAQNLLYQKIQQEKNNGKEFELLEDILSIAENNSEILQEFNNPEEVSFMEYNP